MVADVITIARDLASGKAPPSRSAATGKRAVMPMSDITTGYYIRMSIADQPGVLSQIARTLGDHNISIASAIQKQAEDSVAEIVIMTHPAREKEMQQAIGELNNLEAVKENQQLCAR